MTEAGVPPRWQAIQSSGSTSSNSLAKMCNRISVGSCNIGGGIEDLEEEMVCLGERLVGVKVLRKTVAPLGSMKVGEGEVSRRPMRRASQSESGRRTIPVGTEESDIVVWEERDLGAQYQHSFDPLGLA